MAPTVEQVEQALLARVASHPGCAWTIESLRELYRPLKSSPQAIQTRLEVLLKEGKIVRFPVYPESYISWQQEDMLPKELQGTLIYVGEGTKLRYGDISGGPLTLDRKKIQKGALWVGGKGRWFYMEANDFRATMQKFKEEVAAKRGAREEQKVLEEQEIDRFLDQLAPDARELLNRLQGIKEFSVTIRHNPADKRGPEHVSVDVYAFKPDGLPVLLDILRNGLKEK